MDDKHNGRMVALYNLRGPMVNEDMKKNIDRMDIFQLHQLLTTGRWAKYN